MSGPVSASLGAEIRDFLGVLGEQPCEIGLFNDAGEGLCEENEPACDPCRARQLLRALGAAAIQVEELPDAPPPATRAHAWISAISGRVVRVFERGVIPYFDDGETRTLSRIQGAEILSLADEVARKEARIRGLEARIAHLEALAGKGPAKDAARARAAATIEDVALALREDADYDVDAAVGRLVDAAFALLRSEKYRNAY